MKISLIHPSRGRPDKAFVTANKWLAYSECATEHIFSLDSDDPFVYQYKAHDKLIVNPNTCVVEAANVAAKASTGDILLYLSDDFDCFPGWGRKIMDIAAKYQGEYLIKVHDGLQDFNNGVLTIPIMSRQLYERLGYIFHPAYKSMWVDVDLYYTCVNINAIKLHKEVVFQHNHYSNGKTKKDDTYSRSDANWNQGKETLAIRKRQRFPI